MFETLVESAHRHRSPSRAGAMALAVHVVVVGLALQHTTATPAATPRPPIDVIFAEDPPPPAASSASTSTGDDHGSPAPIVPPIALPGPIVFDQISIDSLQPVDPGVDLHRSIMNDARRVGLSLGSQPGTSPGGGIHLAGEVEEPVRALIPVTPRYPRALEVAGVPGRVVLQFVVDTTGTVEAPSLLVVEASDSAFARSSREALAATRFAPARAGGQVVRQLVRQTMIFTVKR